MSLAREDSGSRFVEGIRNPQRPCKHTLGGAVIASLRRLERVAFEVIQGMDIVCHIMLSDISNPTMPKRRPGSYVSPTLVSLELL